MDFEGKGTVEKIPSPSEEQAPPEAVEQKPLTSVVDDPAVLGARTQKIEMLKKGLDATKVTYEETQAALTTARTTLGLEGSVANSPAQTITQKRILEVEAKIVEAEANYPGDWTLLLHERLLHPATQMKLEGTFATHADSFPDEEPGPLDKADQFLSFQKQQVQDFSARVRDRFQATGVGKASEYGKTEKALGVSQHRIDAQTSKDELIHSGVVFSDASTRENMPLTPRQKNIIEAHEKGHAVRKFSGQMSTEIKQALDPEAIAGKRNYILQADEIVERMSQLKNYFGFVADEQFTATHLKHAREHYVADTGLDNDMNKFLDAITPETEERFLKVINSYPI
ncbi:MAG: hypothetical protein IPJ68_00770 [Candidatus Moraniibacteriota bacterium]|nr:MAG: hypothetical protein IPJ68_00770 [Candidatus Moranbacteria bacterium]